MDKDPWSWDVDEVQDFFRQRAKECIADRADSELPSPDFLRALQEHKISGVRLLRDIEKSDLKDYFNVSSFGVLCTIIHCIDTLRKRSRSYAATQDRPFQEPVAQPLIIQPPAPQLPPISSESASAVGQNVRQGEVRVVDDEGRPRRKLNLVAQEAAVDTPTSQENPQRQQSKDPRRQASTSGARDYLPTPPLPVDEIFYGPYNFNQQIGALELEGDIWVDHDDSEEHNFHFTDQHKSPGEAEYVYRQLQHFFHVPETVNIRRIRKKERKAIAVFPYRETILKHVSQRSATVFELSGGELSATRRIASSLQDGHIETDQQPADRYGDDEWAFLLQKYPDKSECSTEASEESFTSVTDSDEVKSDQCEVEDIASDINPLRVAEIVDKAVTSYITAWKSKIPSLEQNRARTVWNKMRDSKSLRDALITAASSRIESLADRLEKLKENFISDPWQSEQDLFKACESLETTVHDREEQRWNISVWQRARQPISNSSKKVPQKNRSDGPSNIVATFKFSVMPGDDRLSVSPTSAAPITLEGQFRTAMNSPPRHATEPVDQVSANDDMAVFIEEDEVMLDGSESEGPAPSRTPLKPPTPLNTKGLFKGATLHKPVPTTPCGSDSSDTDDLPSPSAVISSGIKNKPLNPLMQFQMRPCQELVDLTHSSDSSSPPTKKRGRRSKNSPTKSAAFNGDATEATAAEVDSWDYGDLCRNHHREHLLIKMLKGWGPERREEAYLRLKSPVFPIKLRAGLQTFKDGNVKASGLNVENGEFGVFNGCAELFVAWYYSDIGILKKPPINRDWLDRIINDEHQQKMFASRLKVILQRRESKLFVEHKPTSPTAPFVISDEDENSPHKTRKRKILKSKAAMQTRNTAQERQEKYNEALAKTNSNSSLIARNPSFSDVPINPAKDEDHDLIYVAPAIAKKMKAHQIDGVRFMWREVTSEDEKDGQGCLLAHTMGLGKTMQAIALLVALIEASQSVTPGVYKQLPRHLRLGPEDRLRRQLRCLVLCPASLIQNWVKEIKFWAPEVLRNFFIVQEPPGLIATLEHWHRVGGVLLMGYEAFGRTIMRKTNKRDGIPVENKYTKNGPIIDKILLEETELVVADEAHRLKNIGTDISLAAARFKTGTRIGLTGTPMSNNVQEIYSLISWVAPGYLGAPVEFQASYAEPIQEGTYEDSSPYEVRRSIKKLQVLQYEIAPKVHRADITALKGYLKPMIEFVITVPLTNLQDTLYKRYIHSVLGDGRNSEVSQVKMFSWLAVLMLLTNHPRAFKNKMFERKKKRNFATSIEDTLESGSSTPVVGDSDIDPTTIPGDEHVGELGFTDDDIQNLIEGVDDSINPSLSAKAMILLDILNLSKACGDSVLIFSGSIPTLMYLQDLLNDQNINFGLLTGNTIMSSRTALVESFSNKDFKVMLVSTRAGGVGLNMQVANRVVIFDFGFNPAHEEQAIGRAYRFGQEKPVFVYRFVAGGTFETNMDNRQLFKASLAKRVVDKKNPKRSAQRDTREWLYEPRHVKQEVLSEWIGKDPHVLDQILDQEGISRNATLHSSSMIRAIKTMETLQAETLDAPLTAAEREEVEIEQQDRKRLRKGLKDKPLPSSSTFRFLPPNHSHPPQPMPTGSFTATQPSQLPVLHPSRSSQVPVFHPPQSSQTPIFHPPQPSQAPGPWVHGHGPNTPDQSRVDFNPFLGSGPTPGPRLPPMRPFPGSG